MAESWMGKNPHDDIIRNALKTELDELKASDELVRKTLEKCRSELEVPREKPSGMLVFNKVAMRFGGTLAACLLITVLVVTLGFNGMSKNKSMAPNTAQFADESAAPAPAPEAAATRYELDKSTGMAKGDMRTNEDSFQAAAPEAPAEPEAGEAPAGADGIMMAGLRGPVQLESLNYGGIGGSASKIALSQSAKEALLKDYNLQNGSAYILNDTEAISVTALKDGGLSAEAIDLAQSYQDLASPRGYWVIPLNDPMGNPAMMLPVFHGDLSKEEKENTGLNLTYSSDGSIWNASAYATLPANVGLVDWIKAPADSGTKPMVLDINRGMDFLVFYTLDGKEYGIPFFSFLNLTGLENGRIYEVSTLLDLLSQSLAPLSP